ncbi:MAG TPA: pyruvate kinase [Chromatiales bacterium]|nr:pyruvate kinase [Thiotrichales bacterium]HIP69131.1 pyruvate kinase [Chromatiales bacterium]
MRRTKIVATLGPATEAPETVEALLRAGVDVVRLNFSHGNPDEHKRRARLVREAAKKLGTTVAILGDLQGPKIRTERFVGGGVQLASGDSFILDMDLDQDAGNQERVGVTYKTLSKEIASGDILLLDDGRIILEVIRVDGPEIHTRVVNGGYLSNNKGINRRGGGLSAGALTDKDKVDIKLAAELDVDYLAVSFPRSAADIEEARSLLNEAGGSAGIVAKIERAEAIEAIDEIIDASDVIMIARGDLGVEIGDAELPAIQKDLIHRARVKDTIAITATQMMESMIENPIPTRAEVFDVANAVLDGTDAVMLSGETAVGKYPNKVVKAMNDICLAAEQQRSVLKSDHRINTRFERVDEAIAMASMYTANHTGAKAIAALTESGATTLWMSRISSGIPIYAMSGVEKTRQRVKLYRGVYPVDFPIKATSHAQANLKAVEILQQYNVVEDGDLVIITKGDLMGSSGGTNAMKIVEVGNMIEPVN